LKRNVGVCQRNSSETNPDDDLVQPQDNNIKPVFLEALSVLLNNGIKILQFSFKDNLNQLEIRKEVGENEFI